MKSRCDTLVDRRPRQQIARDLFNTELIERHVRVEGSDDPIPIGPYRPPSILLVTVGIRVTRQIEPFSRPAFAIMRRIKQTFNGLLIGIRGVVSQIHRQFIRRWWQSNQIERDTPQQGCFVSFRRWR